jgi:hypothetical protein
VSDVPSFAAWLSPATVTALRPTRVNQELGQGLNDYASFVGGIRLVQERVAPSACPDAPSSTSCSAAMVRCVCVCGGGEPPSHHTWNLLLAVHHETNSFVLTQYPAPPPPHTRTRHRNQPLFPHEYG